MSTISDGGPAFPSGLWHSNNESEPDSCYATEPGMSLRDYLAANVSPQEIEWYVPTDLKGCREFLKLSENEPWTNASYMEIVQIVKYRIADAMLKAREANNERD